MRPCFLLEPLESRITLSAGFIAADGVPGGAVTLDLGQEPTWPAFLIQPDEKILISDYTDSREAECEDEYPFLIRFNGDGSRDLRFGDAGIVNLGCQESFDQLLLQPDGKILGMTDDMGISRITRDGKIDKTFHTVVPAFPIPHYDMYDFEHISLGPDGHIFSGGQAWSDDEDKSYLGFLGFKSDGTPDRSFGDRGALSAKYSLPFSWGANFVIQPDGKILIATGDHNDGGDKNPGTLLRFNPDGTPDENFAEDGQFRFNPHETIRSIILQPNGKIILVLSHGEYRTNAPDLTLLRLNSDGTLDESFGIDGRSSSWWDRDNTWYRTLIQSDGKIIVTDYDQGIVARFTASGLLDPAFGFGGVIQIDAPDSDSSVWIDDAFLRPNGHLLLFVEKVQNGAASVHLLDIATDSSHPTDLTSADGAFIISSITPRLNSPQDDQPTNPPEESDFGSDTNSDSPPIVDPADDVAQENPHDPVAQDSSGDVLDEGSNDPFQGDPDAEPWLD